MATGTIQLDPATPAVLGQPCNFLVTTDLHGNNSPPQVEVVALQDVNGDGVLDYSDLNGDGIPDDVVYAEVRLVSPSKTGAAALPFAPLGNGQTLWTQRRGPAHCKATLFYWDNKGRNNLAVIEFDAAG